MNSWPKDTAEDKEFSKTFVPIYNHRAARCFNVVQEDVYRTAKEHGWWEDEQPNIGEKIALMHSELSEALEAVRSGNPPDKHLPEYSSLEVELADCIIRILDLAAHHNWRVLDAVVDKNEYNKTRPYKHGGKAF